MSTTEKNVEKPFKQQFSHDSHLTIESSFLGTHKKKKLHLSL